MRAKPKFPEPVTFGGRTTRWSLSALEGYIARCKGKPAPPERDPDEYLSAAQVSKMFGASIPTIWRWAAEGRRRGAA